jgi:asparagine synthase (glutamine-hydrolysing)
MIKDSSDWKKQIQNIKNQMFLNWFWFITDHFNKKKLFIQLEQLIFHHVKNKKVGILFSGGIDSVLIALICKKLNLNFTCYTIGFYEKNIKFPKDVIFARKIVKQNNFSYKEKLFNLSEISFYVNKSINCLKDNKKCFDVVNVGVATVELAAMSLAEKDNCDLVFTGLGAEEIFAGYKRHRISKNISKDSWKSLLNFYDNDLIRENLVQSSTNIKIISPFTNIDIIKTAMNISFHSKINKTNNKVLLRKYAKKLGLKQVYTRKKLAAQYGSNVNKAIYHIAKKKGFKSRTDYLNSFVDSKNKIFIP